MLCGLMARESDKTVSIWLGQVADALRAGHSPSEAVFLAIGIGKTTTEIISRRFEAGDAWEEVLEEECNFLSESEVAVLIAASKSGVMPESMEALAKARSFRMRSRRLMILGSLYPFALAHLAVAIVPLPRLMDGEYVTYVMNVFMILVPFWAALIMFFAGAKLFPDAVNGLLRFLPLLSGYAKTKNLSIFSNVLSTSLRSGLRIDDAWTLATRSVQSKRFSKLGEEVYGVIMKGREVSPALSKSTWLPDDFVSGYRTAERSGNLEEFLKRLSDRYGDSAMTRLKAAIGAYTAFLLLVAMGFAAWRIISFYFDYFQRIEDLTS